MDAWRLLLGFAGSFVAGYVGSVLGLVLGTLRLPLILIAAGSPASGAGTNIAISAAAAGAGGLRHAREGRVNWRVVAWMAPPSVIGAVVGSLVGGSIPRAGLDGLVAAVLVWSGVDVAFRPVAGRQRERPRLGRGVGLGFMIGAMGGAIGVILGTFAHARVAPRSRARRAIGGRDESRRRLHARRGRVRHARSDARRRLAASGRGDGRGAPGRLARCACDGAVFRAGPPPGVGRGSRRRRCRVRDRGGLCLGVGPTPPA
ncbi:MAG: sulfite exporter TauE/SafE family protein [Actinobacteria bacterium]|nr:MAG: sulfite exporter TauE/SafE family protein [Actinomycetota bacterium]